MMFFYLEPCIGCYRCEDYGDAVLMKGFAPFIASTWQEVTNAYGFIEYNTQNNRIIFWCEKSDACLFMSRGVHILLRESVCYVTIQNL